MSKCPEYGIGDHDCIEHGEVVVHHGTGPCDCWACAPEEES